MASGVLKKDQAVSWAPWEIKKSDLDSGNIKSIITVLHETGKLVVRGNGLEKQMKLFND